MIESRAAGKPISPVVWSRRCRICWTWGRRSWNYYPGTEEAHTNPARQRGECLRALAGASG